MLEVPVLDCEIKLSLPSSGLMGAKGAARAIGVAVPVVPTLLLKTREAGSDMPVDERTLEAIELLAQDGVEVVVPAIVTADNLLLGVSIPSVKDYVRFSISGRLSVASVTGVSSQL